MLGMGRMARCSIDSRFWASMSLWFCIAVLSACSTGPDVPSGGGGLYKVGDPYQINGVWYYPREDYDYDEAGIASWYGPGFNGQRTANGEIYNELELTAAHTTLPMPSLVRVTNLDNGKALVVRINDRGPFKPGRIIDMSRRGAQLLGFDGVGTAKVRVQVLEEESKALKMAALARSPARVASRRTDTVAQAAPVPVAAPRKPVEVVALPPVEPVAAPPPRASAPPAPPTRPSAVQAPVTTLASPIETRPDRNAAVPDRNMAVLELAAADRPIVREEIKTVPGTMRGERFLPRPEVERVPVPANSRIFVQAGSFAQKDNADRLSGRLSAIAPTEVKSATVQNRQLYRVLVGPLASVDAADDVLARVVESGSRDARVIVN